MIAARPCRRLSLAIAGMLAFGGTSGLAAAEPQSAPHESGYSALVEYAVGIAMDRSSQAVPQSALLADPAALDGERLGCESDAPAVLIDLDPAQAVFDPGLRLAPQARLADDLSYLRASGVAIAWLSAGSSAAEYAIRRSLEASGLDPEGEDRILLIRSDSDRKQARRREYAGFQCLLAIAGDEPADFDELYTYLKNPADAAALDALFGAGWFLAPPPLVPAKVIP